LGISGEIQRPDGILVEISGNFVSIQKKGEVHGRSNFTKESIGLFYWDGPERATAVPENGLLFE
jgi:hypothetical protein